ncbi:MAG TPA: tripartite tricarboxylate transporter substrate binding protein [Burkholderiaceae bacterium]|nr:tripartite tricarboxylate transporter substrate binding protein [Burkholderiaceae bacterium]
MKLKQLVALAVLGACGLSPALAQGKFPDGMIKLVVPFAAGGGVDQAARLLGRQLQTDLGVPVIVDNKAGASGTIGGKAVQTSPADGNTLLFSAATHVLAKQVLATPPYDPVTDFVPVARVGEAALLLVIPPNAPQKNVREVLEAVRQQPNAWTAAVPALGAPSHLATLLLAKQGNVKLTMTPYRGTAPALADVAGGHVQILLDSIISLQSMAKGGKVKPIATTSAKRSNAMPDVPTAAESGFPGMVYESWYGVWAPKGLPDERLQLLNKAINKAVAELSKSGAFAPLGIEPVQESVDQFRKYIAADVARSAELLKESGFKPE